MIALLKENDLIDVLQLVIYQRGGRFDSRLQHHEHFEHEALVLFIGPSVETVLLLRRLVQIAERRVVHLDKPVPQEFDVDSAFDVVGQLLPVLGVSRRQVQVDGPPMIEVGLDAFAELKVDRLLGVVVLQRVEKKRQAFRVAWKLSELLQAAEQVTELTHHEAEDGDSEEHDERHDQPFGI